MASTSLSLGDHWEKFIHDKIATGRYGTVTEVVREALRFMETRDQKLEALRMHLSEGEHQAEKGEFIDGFSIDDVIGKLDAEK